MFFTVLEIQVNTEGSRACLPVIYDNYDGALAKFYTICAAAAVSGLPYHSAHILRSDGIMTDSRIFNREA